MVMPQRSLSRLSLKMIYSPLHIAIHASVCPGADNSTDFEMSHAHSYAILIVCTTLIAIWQSTLKWIAPPTLWHRPTNQIVCWQTHNYLYIFMLPVMIKDPHLQYEPSWESSRECWWCNTPTKQNSSLRRSLYLNTENQVLRGGLLQNCATKQQVHIIIITEVQIMCLGFLGYFS